MDANRLGCFAVIEVAKHGIAQHIFQGLPIVALGEDVVAYGSRRIANVGRLPYLKI